MSRIRIVYAYTRKRNLSEYTRLLADCPRNVWASGVYENFTVNGKLSCGSDAHPPAQYQWQVIKGSGFVDGHVFVVNSTGFFNISCTANNFLFLPSDECARTVYSTGYVPLSPRKF